MIDADTQSPVTVSTDGDGGPYIMVPLDQLPAVTSMLRTNGVSFWVDANAISIDGKPEITVVNLGRGVDARHVQRLLDMLK